MGKGFIAIAADEAGDLIPLSLTSAQLERHFPEYGEAGRERVRLADLTLLEQVADLVPKAVGATDPHPLDREECHRLVREIGAPAAAALADVVSGEVRATAGARAC